MRLRLSHALLFTALCAPACADDGGPAQTADTVSDTDTGGTPDTGGEPGFEVAQSAFSRDLDPAANDAELTTLVAGNTTFALDLYRWLRTDKPGDNLFYSPHSISVALAMTYAGARGTTADEMAATLHFDLADPTLHAAMNRLALALDSREDVEVPDGEPFTLRVSNAIWGLSGYPYGQPFIDTLALNYGAGLHLVDFVGNPEGSRETINSWISERTNKLIPELIPDGVIKPTTRMVLTNAIYFFAGWQTPFAKALTVKAPFANLGGTTSQVDLMTLPDTELPYASVDGHQVIELPYVGEDVSMVVILPAAGAFETFEASLDASRLTSLTQGLSRATGTLRMPKLTLKSKFSLAAVLKDLGMPTAFGDAADLSGIASAEHLFIQDVIHEGVVKVDEEGTEAAAATAVIVGTDSEPVSSFEMTVDRPYLFVIRDRPTGAILFVGRVVSME
ncbi:MAG: serpin family protein [Deltaproteobacteria bacterium]|nr:serpin family protein [Deltaproteobacteria bacterium]